MGTSFFLGRHDCTFLMFRFTTPTTTTVTSHESSLSERRNERPVKEDNMASFFSTLVVHNKSVPAPTKKEEVPKKSRCSSHPCFLPLGEWTKTSQCQRHPKNQSRKSRHPSFPPLGESTPRHRNKKRHDHKSRPTSRQNRTMTT